jgi:hypothetical protein
MSLSIREAIGSVDATVNQRECDKLADVENLIDFVKAAESEN